MPAERSLEGSAAVFVAGWLAAWVALAGTFQAEGMIWIALTCAGAGALAEAVSNHGLDNLTVQLAASGTAFLLLA